ncbi:MAG: hypothetical protein GX220_01185 [Treponema sp.]|nr:hypothetical protein [Treponema sp.]
MAQYYFSQIKKIIIFFTFSGFLFFSSCSQEFTTHILNLKNSVAGTYFYFDKHNNLQCLETVAQQNFSLLCEKKQNPVFFIPNIQQNSRTVTGCIFPQIKSNDAAGGFCAQVFIRVVCQSNESVSDVLHHCSLFNWQKLYEKITQFSDEEIAKIDQDKIVQHIASKNFSVYSIKVLK